MINVLLETTGLDLNKESCYHHHKMYLTQYVGLQKYCCDPYNAYVGLQKYCCDPCNRNGDNFITSGKNICLIFFI